MLDTLKKNWKSVCIPALITFLGLSVRLTPLEWDCSELKLMLLNLTGAFVPFSISNYLLIPCLILFYCFVEEMAGGKEQDRWHTRLPSLLFALFMVVGFSFQKTGTLDLVLDWKHAGLVKSALAVLGYDLLFRRLLRLVFFAFDRYRPAVSAAEAGWRPLRWYQRQLARHPFRTVFLTLIVCYLPTRVITFPATFMGDTWSQIAQAFSELKNSGIDYVTTDRLLSDQVYINQHHPVLHTLLIHWFLLLGDRLFHSFNIGIFLFSTLQAGLLIASISHLIAVLLRKRCVTTFCSICILLYCVIHPLLQDYMFLITKDVFYAAALLLLIAGLYQLLSGQQDRAATLSTLAASVFMVLFRNDSTFILPIAFILIAVLCPSLRKVMVTYCVIVVLLTTFLSRILFPALSYTPGSRREMLSLPFQQTARYVRDHGDDVTEEEREAIDAVLPYDGLAGRYYSVTSDNVKGSFRETASNEELMRYLQVWAKMLLKHPGTYVQAAMDCYYQYFYPDGMHFNYYGFGWSANRMGRTNSAIEPLGQSFSYPEGMAGLRETLDQFGDALRTFPVLSLLICPAVYSWVLIVLFFYALRRRSIPALALLLPVVEVLGICLLGPRNGVYARYQYPLVVLMPGLVFMVLNLVHTTAKNPAAPQAKERHSQTA